ncbi:MAG: oligosaccharyl transferase, archaeosortase A system-associated [Dehalococcoidales bacterium]|nr:oligosaccharyl transferase, archaeosortase A system-associated [Dehalococcoidales bacterium]
MRVSTTNGRLIAGILIFLAFGISLLFRIILPVGQVFNDGWIKFTSIDAYFYQRVIDVTATNFPRLMDFDPYFVYPGGRALNDIFFPSWITAAVIWVLTGGSPTQQAIDTISVFLPGIFAALTVIPAYFIGKALFGRGAGVIAAILTAVFPGEYLGRSIIGMTDTHVVETLLSTTFMAFIVLAIKSAHDSGLSQTDFRRWERRHYLRPLLFGALAGLFLAMYCLSWMGALLFVFILAVYLTVQAINDHLRQQPLDYLAVIGIPPLLIALAIFAPFSPRPLYTICILGGLAVPVVLIAISWLMLRLKLRPVYFPVALVAIAAIGLAIFYAISPGTLRAALGLFQIFAPSGASAITTVEMQPFLDPDRVGKLNLVIPWGNFTTSFFLLSKIAFPGIAFISLAFLIYLFIRRHKTDGGYLRPAAWITGILAVIMLVLLLSGYGQPWFTFIPAAVLFGTFFLAAENDRKKHWLLFFIWTLVMLLLTLAQRRFAYYFIINIALLSAYISWQAIWVCGAKRLAETQTETAPAGAAQKRTGRHTTRHVLFAAIAGIAVFLIVILPNVVKATEMTTKEEAPYAPSDAWMSALLWIRENTPEPFGDPSSYYRVFPAPPKGEKFAYPDSAYGVTSWWDYGYWITHIAHRLPSANPAQEPARIIDVANLFLSEDETSARELLRKMDSAYVIIDDLTVTSKFWAIATWAGKPDTKYYETYSVSYQGALLPVHFYKIDYYRTLAVRLFNFDGRKVTDIKPFVITWVDRQDRRGNSYRQVTEIKDCTSYEEAQDYLRTLRETKNEVNCAIVGVNPFVSPVPLEAVPGFKLIYSSEQGSEVKGVGFVPEVKVFEYAE